VVVPVYNEQRDLGPSVRRTAHAHLERTFRTVPDHHRRQREHRPTPEVAGELAAELDRSRAAAEQKGRGARCGRPGRRRTPRAGLLRRDLSTDLAALLPLVAPLVSGHSDLAIGTRSAEAPGGQGDEARGIRRLQPAAAGALATGFSDAQCGFKRSGADAGASCWSWCRPTAGLRHRAARAGERAGLRIHEVPVDLGGRPDSRVDIVATAMPTCAGVLRLNRALGSGALPLADVAARLGREPAVRSTGVRRARGSCSGSPASGDQHWALPACSTCCCATARAQAANLGALLVTAVGTRPANRVITFGDAGPAGAARHHARALVLFGLGWR